MRYSLLVSRIVGDGASAWDLHYQALARRSRGEDVIVLSAGDPDFDTPVAITEAAVASLRAGRTHYSRVAGEPELREVIAARHARSTGQITHPEQVVVVAGAQCGLFATLLCLLEAGDEVIVLDPVYVTYEATAGACGARLVRVPTSPERGFYPDPADIAAAVTRRTRAILLNTPQNPTGAVLQRSIIEAVAAICRQHDLWLISDEVYADLVFDGEHVSPASLPAIQDRVVVISSLSKSHAMTGWRVGWVIAPRELASHLSNLALAMLYGCSSFIQDAAVTALTGDFPEVASMRQVYRERRDAVVQRLGAAPRIRCRAPRSGVFVMVDVRETGMGAREFAARLLHDYDVSVLAGEAFGPAAAGHIRLSLTMPQKNLLEGCDRIAACAAGVEGRRRLVSI